MDGSEASASAVRFSTKVAKATGWELVLVHILDEERATKELGQNVNRQRLAEPADRSYLELKLEEIVKLSAPEIWMSGVRYSTRIEVGDPTEKVIEVAKRVRAEMIVMGFVGHHGASRIRALGSVARAVAESSEIPVVVVPEKSIDLEESQTAWW